MQSYRNKNRNKIRWRNDVVNDLRKIKPGNWMLLVKNRKASDDKVQKTKQRAVFYYDNNKNNNTIYYKNII
jgi:hypothetical protein